MSMPRRRFLQGTTMLALSSVLARSARAIDDTRGLVPDPRGILDLPPDFRYHVVERAGAPMDDGFTVPGRPDGMGCFDIGDGKLVLLRNHEIFEGDTRQTPYVNGRAAPAQSYDPRAGGGVSRVVLDAHSGRRLSSNLALAGTYWNCAGGHSPWGWLSCEETTSPGHGYVFLVDPAAPGVQQARPLRALGRFRHEAAVTHPRSHITYLTEDEPDGAFYRHVPTDPSRPFEGKLQALAALRTPRLDTARLELATSIPMTWVDLDATDSTTNDLRHRAHARGAARIARGEGIVLDADAVYFSATVGGPVGRGQILRLQLDPAGDQLSVISQSRDPAALDMPDNLAVSPAGELFVAEDGLGQNRLHRIAADGSTIPFAANVGSRSELTGPCFSPDGRWLFLNMQLDGLTLAISGPFSRIRSGTRSRRQDGPLPPGAAGLAGGLSVLALAAMRSRRR